MNVVARILSVTVLGLSSPLVTLAQPPGRPPLTIEAPDLGYRAVDPAEAFHLPEGLEFGSVASVEFTPDGNVMVLHRGQDAFLEFDPDGNFIRSFGRDMFARVHAFRYGPDGNIWATDGNGQTLTKMTPDGEVLQTWGTRGERGVWDPATGTMLFDEPNEMAWSSNGDMFLVQGHTRGEPRVLKFDSEGNFVKIWGRRGTGPEAGPGEFSVPHSIVIDENDRVYVADRENQRIQIFDTDGNYLEEWTFDAMVCALYFGADGYLYMTTGFDAQIVKLDMEGNVLAVTGSSGEGPNQYGEAHYLAVSPTGTIYVADVVNRRVEKLVPR